MGDFISKLNRLAVMKNIAILLTNQSTTRIKSETRAVLHPAISGTAWDSGISTRLVLFRDWKFQNSDTPGSQPELIPGVRFAVVLKAKGVLHEGVGRMATFTIEKVSFPSRLFSLMCDESDISRRAFVK